jgi:hypothetical protein
MDTINLSTRDILDSLAKAKELIKKYGSLLDAAFRFIVSMAHALIK